VTTLLHLSDPHLDGSDERADRLRAVLDLLPPSRRPDAIVVTGDIADNGAGHEYAQFQAVMEGREPWLAVPGNHDTPALLGASPFLDVGDLRVLGLDVTVAGEDHGDLRDEVAEQAVSLAAGAGRTVLAFHQPPMRIGHSYADLMRLLNAEVLAALVERIGTVEAILCGHVHTASASSFAGVPVLVAPGIVSALRLDPGHPQMADQAHAPGMALHSFEHGTVTTTFHYAG
jgi:Icc protein